MKRRRLNFGSVCIYLRSRGVKVRIAARIYQRLVFQKYQVGIEERYRKVGTLCILYSLKHDVNVVKLLINSPCF